MASKPSAISKTQIDRLGERLRDRDVSETDLRLLDQYRRSFGAPYEFVIDVITTKLGLSPTGRPAKSTPAISEKLKRESIRLTQMQDIAGCRLIVEDIREQELVVSNMAKTFEDITVVDRRAHPSHGYRAVHIVVRYQGKPTEVQVRTRLQHRWAEFSEKLADVFDPALKYGAGEQSLKEMLVKTSNLIHKHEHGEIRMLNLTTDVQSHGLLSTGYQQSLAELQSSLQSTRQQLEKFVSDMILDITRLEGL